MAFPDAARPKNTLHLSLPAELVRQVGEVAYRKRRHVSHPCRDFIEAGMQKLVQEKVTTGSRHYYTVGCPTTPC